MAGGEGEIESQGSNLHTQGQLQTEDDLTQEGKSTAFSRLVVVLFFWNRFWEVWVTPLASLIASLILGCPRNFSSMSVIL